MGDDQKSENILTPIKMWISKISEKKPVRYLYSFTISIVTAGGIIGICAYASVAIVPAAILAAIGGALAGYFANKSINHLMATRDAAEVIPLLQKEIGDLKITLETERENYRKEKELTQTKEKRKETTYKGLFNIFAKHLKDDIDRKDVINKLESMNSDDENDDVLFEHSDVKIDLPSDLSSSDSRTGWNRFGTHQFSLQTAQADTKENTVASTSSKPTAPSLNLPTAASNNIELMQTAKENTPLLSARK